MDIDAYREAVDFGRRAAGAHRDDTDPVVDVWVGHVRQYAKDVPGRIADELASTLTEEDDGVQSVAEVLTSFNAKLEALRSSITRYAEPPWGAGNNGYGAQLEDRNILMDWVLDSDDPCTDCVGLAGGSPYEHLPTWPKMGDTVCLDRCYCSVQADAQSWEDSLAA